MIFIVGLVLVCGMVSAIACMAAYIHMHEL